MKKTRLSLLILSSALLLAACGGNQNSSTTSEPAPSSSDSAPSSSDPATSGGDTSSSSEEPVVPLEDERQILIKDLPDLGLGEKLDLNDYVTIVRAKDEAEDTELYWSYDILYDNVHGEIASIVSPSRPYIGQSTVLQGIRTGRVNIRITTGEVSKTAYFDVTINDQMKKVNDYFEEAKDNNFTISLGETVSVYRTQNYIYYPSEYWGVVLNTAQAKGYYFQLNSPTDADSLKIGVKGTYAGNEEVTLSSFAQNYPALATIFGADNFQYSQGLYDYFGEEYSVAMLYDADDTTDFVSALNLLNLSSSYYTIGSYYYYIGGFVPMIDDEGNLSLYVLYNRSRGTVASTSLLGGPYVFSDVGTTAVKALDDYVASEGTEVLGNREEVNSKLFGITSYTSHAVGQFEDINGQKEETPEYFASALPELDITVKVDENGYENTRMDYVDGGNDEHVLILNGDANATKYVLNGSGEYTSSAAYGNDPTSGQPVSKWENSSTFSVYKPSVTFIESTWNYATYVLGEEPNTYYMMGINDSLGRSMMNYIIRGTTAAKFMQSGSPIAYYGFYSYMFFDIGSTATDDMTFDYYTRVIDGDGDYHIYHLTITMTDINSTVLTTPKAAA